MSVYAVVDTTSSQDSDSDLILPYLQVELCWAVILHLVCPLVVVLGQSLELPLAQIPLWAASGEEVGAALRASSRHQRQTWSTRTWWCMGRRTVVVGKDEYRSGSSLILKDQLHT